MEMVDYIHREFLQLLNEVDWMDEDTRQRGIEKGTRSSSRFPFPHSSKWLHSLHSACNHFIHRLPG